jgi:hypothetical protein
MNAISRPEPASETRPETRTERHMRMCQRLAELAMELAETVVARAREEMKTPAADAPKARTPDAATLFTRLSAAALKAITLEAKLAGATAGGGKSKAAEAAAAALNDPRRDIIRQVVDLSTASFSNRGQLRRDIMRMADQALARDPAKANQPYDVLEPIFNDLNLEINYQQMSDELLDQLRTDPVGPPAPTV